MASLTIIRTVSSPPSTGDLALPVTGRQKEHPRSWSGWAAVGAVSVLPLTQIARILVGSPKVALYGDQALIAIAARRAGGFQQFLGPYSRTGFHHPGPAMFYLLAPFVHLGASVGAGLYIGASAMNLASLVAVVALIWRCAGPICALWSATAIDLFVLCLGAGTLREPWNPYLVIAPMLLFIVLWAAATSGWAACCIWTLVVGSYELQTHIATAPLVIALFAAMLLQYAVVRPRAERHFGFWLGAAALTLIWVAPIVELFRDHPNNLEQLWGFFTAGHTGPGWDQVFKVGGESLTVLPFGNRDYVLSLNRTPLDLVVGIGLTAGALGAAWILGRRQHRSFPARLVEASVAVAVIGMASLARSDGPVYLYFALWMSIVPLCSLIALVSLSWRPRFAGVALTAALCLSVVTLGYGLALPPVDQTIGSGPWPAWNAGTTRARERTVADTGSLDRAAIAALRPGDRSAVITIGAPSVWPLAAGVALALEERNIRISVAPQQWVSYFGPNPTGTASVQPCFELSPVSKGPSTREIDRVDGTALSFCGPETNVAATAIPISSLAVHNRKERGDAHAIARDADTVS